MASTQKKRDTTKTSASGKASAHKTSSGKSAGNRKKTPPRPAAPAYRPDMLTRGVGAAVCLFAALLLTLGLLGVQGAIPDLLCQWVRGIVGSGFFLTIPVLVWAAGLLLLRREKSPALRLWCLGLIPVIGGAFLHVLLAGGSYPQSTGLFGQLWDQGIQGPGGGVLSGLLGVFGAMGFSRVGAGLIYGLVLLVLIALAAHLTPAKVRSAIRDFRERRESWYEDEEEEYVYDDEPYQAEEDDLPPPIYHRQNGYPDLEPQVSAPPPRRSLWPGRSRKRAPDLPLDDPAPRRKDRRAPEPEPSQKKVPSAPPAPEPLVEADRPAAAAAQVLQGEKEHFFDTNTRVKRPDEVLDELGADQGGPRWQTVDHTPPAPETKAQRQAAIHQEAQAVEQTIQETLEGEGPQVYHYPPLDLLTPPSGESAQAAHQELEGTLERLDSVLSSFGIDGHVVGAVQGPSVTRYEVSLEQGVRLNKLTNLSDDVALALGVSSVRIAPVPGKISVVGIEVPNKVVIPVNIREVLESPAFQKHKSQVAFSVGKDIGGNYIVGDCSKLPHMLIAGTTGSGKSVCINSLLISMLYKSTPQELRLIMVDPKMVELGGYNGIPHLLIPVVTDPKKAAGALQWAVTEMMKRYRMFAEAGVRELSSYNHWAESQEGAEPMPKVVIVIDELADLMLVAAKEVEESICRVAQMGRAAGMHLVIATQRPSADVITGLMKANIPSRIAFAVASSLESRIILDNTGAEKLVGKGDMLWYPLGSGKPLRVQGCFISDEEVAAVVDSVKQNAAADYDDEVMEQIEQHVTESEKKGKSSGGAFPAGDGSGEEQDEHFEEGVEVILELGQASVSMLQRRLKLGYARAARLMDQIEEKGIVGPSEGAKPRQILITRDQWERMKNGEEAAGTEVPPPVEDEILSFDPIPQEYEGP